MENELDHADFSNSVGDRSLSNDRSISYKRGEFNDFNASGHSYRHINRDINNRIKEDTLSDMMQSQIDMSARSNFWNRLAGDRNARHMHQRAESCSNCHTRMQVIKLRPFKHNDHLGSSKDSSNNFNKK